MSQFRSAFRAFTIALVATVLIVVVRRFVLIPLFEFKPPVLPIILAIMLAAWIGGLKSGLFATVLNAGLPIFFRNGEPDREFGFYLVTITSQLRFIMIVGVGGLISWGVESLNVGRRRLEDRHQELEREVCRREQVEMALREREERIRMAVESTDIGTFDFNPVTGQRHWSDRAKIMFGLSPDTDVTNVSFLERVHPEDRERARRAVEMALEPDSDGKYDIDLRLVLPDGSIHWFIAKGQAFFEGEPPNRRANRFIGTVFEVTDRKVAEDALRASEVRFREILDHMPAAISLKDLEERYVLVNRGFEDLLGVENDQIAGLTNYELIPKARFNQLPIKLADQFVKIDRKVIRTGELVTFEDSMPSGDDPRLFTTMKFPIKDASGRITGVGGISLDVTERRRALDSLAAEQEMLRHTIEVQDHERQLVAYEIHDGLVQYVTGALMQLEGMQDKLKSEAIAQQFETIVGILRKAVDEGRRIISGIHATVLDDCGVVAAVQQLIDDEERAHVQVEFVKDESVGRMACTSEEALYRITQEALTNFYKHSQSNKVRIELSRRGDRVHLEVRDWGVGLTQPVNAKGVHGLRGMTERAKIAGGECRIENAHGGGTQVVVDLPYLSRN